jgi:hypothetical protein
VFLAIALPFGVLAVAVLGPLVAAIVGLPGLWVTALVTRRVTATVDRDRPLRHHLAVAVAEATATRRTPTWPLRVGRYQLDPTRWRQS